METSLAGRSHDACPSRWCESTELQVRWTEPSPFPPNLARWRPHWQGGVTMPVPAIGVKVQSCKLRSMSETGHVNDGYDERAEIMSRFHGVQHKDSLDTEQVADRYEGICSKSRFPVVDAWTVHTSPYCVRPRNVPPGRPPSAPRIWMELVVRVHDIARRAPPAVPPQEVPTVASGPETALEARRLHIKVHFLTARRASSLASLSATEGR